MGIARPLLCSVAGYGWRGAEQEANGSVGGSPAGPRPLQRAQHHWEAAAPWPLLDVGSPAGCASQKCSERRVRAGWDDAPVPAHLVPPRVAKGSGTEASGARGGAAGRGVCCWSFTPEPASAGERLSDCKRLKLCPCVYFSWLPHCIITCQHFRWGFICALKIAWGGRMQTLCSMLENVPPA